MKIIFIILFLLIPAHYTEGQQVTNKKEKRLNKKKTNRKCLADPYPAEFIDSSGLSSREGSIKLKARDGNIITAYTYKATKYRARGPILFIMHGMGRTAQSYLSAFKAIGERNNALLIAPEFPITEYPNAEDYSFGVGINGTPDAPYYSAEWRLKENYIYSEIDHFFEAIKSHVGSTRCNYLIFGHSAGGQFIHRLITFRSDSRVKRAVAANSGWYTLPIGIDIDDPNNTVPYGLYGTAVSRNETVKAFKKELIILLGSEDKIRDDSLRKTTEADAQGLNRLERGHYYFLIAHNEASNLNTKFKWLKNTVLGAGHHKDEMAASAGWYLFRNKGEIPCESSTAAEASLLVINEILADPANDLTGDANGDGIRSNIQDEFIELVNGGNTDICLSGWTIGDAANPIRHRFPIGSKILAGKALVVFGGGIPTGKFGGIPVQTALYARSLSLTNAGDILTLKDHQDNIHTQLNWGDCYSLPCLGESISIDLDKNQSIVRSPDITGDWNLHSLSNTSGTLFSPGTKTSGSKFKQLKLEYRRP